MQLEELQELNLLCEMLDASRLRNYYWQQETSVTKV